MCVGWCPWKPVGLDSLELELQVVVDPLTWVLPTELGVLYKSRVL